jgi:uncharacterized membrane protein YqiK
MAVALAGAIVGAVLGWLGGYTIYRRQRAEAKAAYQQQGKDAEAAYQKQRSDAEIAYQKQQSDAEASHQKQLAEAEMRTSVEKVVRLHDHCAAAKDWLRSLPNLGDALRAREHDLRSEASNRSNQCYTA